MRREVEPTTGGSTITRRQVLETGAKLVLLWSLPIVRSTSALAQGSQACDGPHDTAIKAAGQACNQAAAQRRLEKKADKRSAKYCTSLDSCPSGDCGFVARGPVANLKCKQVPDPTCRTGMAWRCTASVTSVMCACPGNCGCDPNNPCEAAIDCHNSGGACNCWVTSPDNGGQCFCGQFVMFCGETPLCPNGQSDCDSQLPGSTCVGTCCGQVCAPPCGSPAVPKRRGSGRRTTRTG